MVKMVLRGREHLSVVSLFLCKLPIYTLTNQVVNFFSNPPSFFLFKEAPLHPLWAKLVLMPISTFFAHHTDPSNRPLSTVVLVVLLVPVC